MIIRANKHLNKRPFHHCVVLTLFLFHIGYFSAQEAITLDRRSYIALSPQAFPLRPGVVLLSAKRMCAPLTGQFSHPARVHEMIFHLESILTEIWAEHLSRPNQLLCQQMVIYR